MRTKRNKTNKRGGSQRERSPGQIRYPFINVTKSSKPFSSKSVSPRSKPINELKNLYSTVLAGPYNPPMSTSKRVNPLGSNNDSNTKNHYNAIVHSGLKATTKRNRESRPPLRHTPQYTQKKNTNEDKSYLTQLLQTESIETLKYIKMYLQQEFDKLQSELKKELNLNKRELQFNILGLKKEISEMLTVKLRQYSGILFTRIKILEQKLQNQPRENISAFISEIQKSINMLQKGLTSDLTQIISSLNLNPGLKPELHKSISEIQRSISELQPGLFAGINKLEKHFDSSKPDISELKESIARIEKGLQGSIAKIQGSIAGLQPGLQPVSETNPVFEQKIIELKNDNEKITETLQSINDKLSHKTITSEDLTDIQGKLADIGAKQEEARQELNQFFYKKFMKDPYNYVQSQFA
jgi:hypothetical protein